VPQARRNRSKLNINVICSSHLQESPRDGIEDVSRYVNRKLIEDTRKVSPGKSFILIIVIDTRQDRYTDVSNN